MAFADPESRQSLLASPSVVGLQASSARREWVIAVGAAGVKAEFQIFF